VIPVEFAECVVDDIRRLGRSTIPLFLRKVAMLDEHPDAGLPLRGQLVGNRKVTFGRTSHRIIYTIDSRTGGAFVWCVGARANDEVYRLALQRVSALTNLERVSASELTQRLGRYFFQTLGSDDAVVPDWLASKILERTSISGLALAAMTATSALEMLLEYVENMAWQNA
jgi:mRNA-degrading endonuclease RelE of RelBE toxin-antitoxin system